MHMNVFQIIKRGMYESHFIVFTTDDLYGCSGIPVRRAHRGNQWQCGREGSANDRKEDLTGRTEDGIRGHKSCREY